MHFTPKARTKVWPISGIDALSRFAENGSICRTKMTLRCRAFTKYASAGCMSKEIEVQHVICKTLSNSLLKDNDVSKVFDGTSQRAVAS